MTGMEKTEFIRCPLCGNKTRDKIRATSRKRFKTSAFTFRRGNGMSMVTSGILILSVLVALLIKEFFLLQYSSYLDK